MTRLLIMAAGVGAVFVAWRVVAVRGATVWTVVTPTLILAGAAAVAVDGFLLSGSVPAQAAMGVGIGAGLALYGGTALFVRFAERLALFGRHVGEIYDQRGGLTMGWALLLAAAVTAPFEELFWRGLFQSTLGRAMGSAAGAALTWVAYVAANAGSGNLPILAGAMVGGAVWGALAMWSRGVLAGVACHALWTALMVMRPPGRRADGSIDTAEGSC